MEIALLPLPKNRFGGDMMDKREVGWKSGVTFEPAGESKEPFNKVIQKMELLDLWIVEVMPSL